MVSIKVSFPANDPIDKDTNMLPLHIGIMFHTKAIGYMEGVYIEDYNPARHLEYIDVLERSGFREAYWLCFQFNPSVLIYDCKHLVLLTQVFLEKNYRGKNYSVDAMNLVTKWFLPGTVIVLLPAPMGSASDYAAQRLKVHWKQCGFKKCRRAQCYYKECD